MIAIEDQLDNVLFGHFRKLPREDVLQIKKFLHALVPFVVLNDHEFYDSLILFIFGSLVSVGKAEARGLYLQSAYLSINPNEGVDFRLLLTHLRFNNIQSRLLFG